MPRNLAYMGLAAALMLTPACAQTNDREQVEEIVYNYLMENPEILEEVLVALQAKRQLEAQAEAEEQIIANLTELISNPGDNTIGPADAPVTVVEFFDYKCGYCKRSAGWVSKLPEQYENKVRVVFKDYPILSPESETEARAAVAAGKQGKYIEMHMALMDSSNQADAGDDRIDQLAEQIGLDLETFRADMQSEAVQRTIVESMSLARRVGIEGTPNFIVGTKLVGGADKEQVESLIEAALAGAG